MKFEMMNIYGNWIDSHCNSWRKIISMNTSEITDASFNNNDIRIFLCGCSVYIYRKVK
jgi:hypothetical protein